MAKQVVAEMCKAYTTNNVDVVIEAFVTPGEDYQSWKDLLKSLEVKTIILLPSRESVIVRNNQREGIEKLKDEDVIQNYEWSENWKKVEDVTLIDNTNKTVEATVDEIID